MSEIVGISGSLRKGSFNAALLRAAAELAPAGMRVDVASIRDVPLYDGDVETERGIPDVVRELKDRIARADGLLLVTPEHNGSRLPVLRTLGTCPWFGPRLMVGTADRAFDAAGKLVDDRLRAQAQAFMAGFAEFVARAH